MATGALRGIWGEPARGTKSKLHFRAQGGHGSFGGTETCVRVLLDLGKGSLKGRESSLESRLKLGLHHSKQATKVGWTPWACWGNV